MLARAYERWILPPLLDTVCGMGILHRERARVVPRAHGRVLEIGIGSGLNLPHYQRDRISELCAVDPSAELTGKARKRAASAGLDVTILQLGAERVPADDAYFDSIVCTFTLCTIPDASAALAEMRRVLKPEGELLFCEHGLAPDARIARWQQRLNAYWRPCAGGCNLNRDTPRMLREAGFAIDELTQNYLPGPKPWTFVSRGVARTAPAPD